MPAEGGDLFERACSLYRTGRTLEARDAYIELLKREPGHLLALNHLGSLLYETGYRTAARTAYAESVARHPDDVMSRVNLANALRESGEPSEARRHYEAALRVQPEHREANQGLANLLADAGDHSGAAELWRRGFEKRPIVTTPYRGERPAVSVLLLATPARGNVQMRHFLDDTVFQTHIVYVEYLQHAQPLPAHSLVINAIGDADLAAPALHAAQALLARTSAPVMNAPGAVLATGRAETAARLNGIPGLVTPRTVTLPRAMLEGIEGHGFSFPLLVRTPGFHTGLHFERVESSAELPAKLAALPGDELTAIEYLDARGSKGKTRKYRTMMIDGELYPLHAAVSSDWKIHYFTAEMADHPEHRAEDLEFLENMQGVLGAKAMNALREIQARLGLDYAGIDFGLNRDGDVLFFEANATMVVNRPEPDEKWAYRRPAVERIYAAVREMLLRKCGVG